METINNELNKKTGYFRTTVFTLSQVDLIFKIIRSVVMGFLGFLMIIPFLWMISSSFKDPISMFNYPIEWIPKKFNFQSYKDVWLSSVPFANCYLNSIKVSLIAVTGTFFTCSMAGYAYAKIKFPGRDLIFILMLSTSILPQAVTMLPTLSVYSFLGIVDTHAALYLPNFFGGAFGVFLMRQFFTTIPTEIVEAAKIDGHGHFSTYLRIMLPIARPALATLVFIYFVWTWNNYESPLLFLRTSSKYTLPLALRYFTDENFTNYSAIMAGAVSTTVPVIMLFLLAQKHFVQGLASGAVKG